MATKIVARKNPPHPSLAAANEFRDQMTAPSSGAAAGNPPPTVSPTQHAAPTPTPAAPAAPAPDPTADLRSQLEARQREIAERDARLNDLDTRYRETNEDLERERRIAEDRVARAREEAAAPLSQQLSELRQRLAERDERLAQIEDDQLIDPAILAQTEHISPDAARELVDRILKPTVAAIRKRTAVEMDTLRSTFKQSEEGFTKRIGEVADANSRTVRRLVNERILHAHPDFMKLKESREFQEFEGRTPPGARQTFGQLMADAYAEGDHEYVSTALNTFKEGRPRVTDVADVDNRTVSAGQPARTGSEPSYSYQSLTDWRYEFQRGEITRAEYRARLAKFDEAKKAGRVK